MRLCWQAHGRQKEQPCKGLGESVQAFKAEPRCRAAGVMGSMAGCVARDATRARCSQAMLTWSIHEIFKDHFGGEVGMQMPERV